MITNISEQVYPLSFTATDKSVVSMGKAESPVWAPQKSKRKAGNMEEPFENLMNTGEAKEKMKSLRYSTLLRPNQLEKPNKSEFRGPFKDYGEDIPFPTEDEANSVRYKSRLEPAQRYKPVQDRHEARQVTLTGKVLKSLSGSIYDVNDDGLYLGSPRERIPDSQIADRIEDIGAVASIMLALIKNAGIITRPVGLLNQRRELMVVKQKNSMLAIAYSLVVSEVPLQLEIEEQEVIDLFLRVVPRIESVKNRLDLDNEKKLKLFKPKRNKAVDSRANVWFSEAWQ